MSAMGICHKCKRKHKSHTMTPINFKDGKYYFEAIEGSVKVDIGNTCYDKLWKEARSKQ